MTDSSKPLSKSAQTIQAVLSQKGLDCTVIELESGARTAADAAAALGCTVAQIVKSLVFKTANSHKPILILASGVNRVNEKAIEEKVGEKIIKADADFTREKTGFAIGGIPPIGHKEIMTTFIDEDLLMYEELWAAAGTPHAVFNLQPKWLAEMTGGEIVSVK